MEFVISDQSGQMKALEAVRALDLKKRWRVTIKRYVKKRSVSQNALYWSWLGQLSEYTGYETDELHEWFKDKFLAPVPVELGGEKRAARTTTKLTTSDFMDYLDRIQRFSAQEIGVQLAYPNEPMGE